MPALLARLLVRRSTHLVSRIPLARPFAGTPVRFASFYPPAPMSSADSTMVVSSAAGVRPTACVIFMHGSGGCGEEYAELFDASVRALLPHCLWLFPSATPRPYTLFGGEELAVWFDRNSLGLGCKEDAKGIEASVEQVQRALQEHAVALGIPRSRTVIGGFSQGGGLALYAAYGKQNEEAYAGCVVIGSFLPHPTTLLDPEPDISAAAGASSSSAAAASSASAEAAPSLSEAIPASLRGTPLLMLHGTRDPVVPWISSLSTFSRLSSRAQLTGGVEHVQRKDMVHMIDEQARQRIVTFIQQQLPPMA